MMSSKAKKNQSVYEGYFEKYVGGMKELEIKERFYARAKWEFSRRNEEFKEFFVNSSRKRQSGLIAYDVSKNKWKLHKRSFEPLSAGKTFEELLEVTFEEIIYNFAINEKHKERKKFKDAYSYGLNLAVQALLPDEPRAIWCEFDETYAFDEDNGVEEIPIDYLTIKVDMRFCRSIIKEEFERFIDSCHPGFLTETELLESACAYYPYDSFNKCLAIYDMKMKGYSTTAIGKKLFPLDFGPGTNMSDHNRGRTKVGQRYKKAKELISKASTF